MMQQKLELDLYAPGNESLQHWWLKQCARAWLRPQQVDAVGLEVGFRALDTGRPRFPVVDVVGIGRRHDATGRSSQYPLRTAEGDERVSIAIEVKVSRSDFLSGYHTPCQFNYVLVPTGLVDMQEVPEGVGLLYYQADTRAPERNAWCWDYPGWISMERRAEEQETCPLPADEAAYFIAYSLTGEVLRNMRIKESHPFEVT